MIKKELVLSLILFLALSPLAAEAREGKSAEVLLGRALHEEELGGNLEGAITTYKKVVTEHSEKPELAARAQLQIGICYEKLGKQEAEKAYQRVVENYPSQQEAVRVAREGLARLDARQKEPASAITVRELIRSGEWSYDKISDPTIDASEIAMTSDGETFIYTDWMTGDLVVNHLSSGKAYALYDVDWFKSEEFFEAPVLSPDEKRIAFLNFSWANNRTVAKVEADSVRGGRRRTLYVDKSVSYVIPQDWSPDGKSILAVFEALDRSISLVAIATAGKTVQRLVTLNWEYPRRADYSPDGSFIAHDSTKDGDRKIYLISADGLQEQVLVDSPGEDDSPLWVPDGRFLLFRSSRSGNWDLMALPMERGRAVGDPLLIKSNIGEATFLRSMTRDRRLFYGEQVAGPGIELMDRSEKSDATGRLRELPKTRTRSQHRARFFPDGKHLAYIAGSRFPYEGGNQVLRITDLNGKVVKDLPPRAEIRWIFGLSVSPDGKKLAVMGHGAKRQSKIFLLSAETGTVLREFAPLTEQGSTLELFRKGPFDWSRDSRLLYFLGSVPQANEAVHVTLEVESGKTARIPLPELVDRRAARISPDQNYLIWAVKSNSAAGPEIKSNLVLRSLADGTERVLKKNVQISRIDWDHNSRHIFYKKGKDEARLYRLSIETGAEELFSKNCRDLHITDVSRDGRHLAFQSNRQDWRIWTVENFLPKAKKQLSRR